jgi:hypothetical protein
VSVKDARYFYENACRVARSHDNWCPLYSGRDDCEFKAFHWARVEATSIALDNAVSLAHPHPRDLGAVQQRAWMARLDATLIREVAF